MECECKGCDNEQFAVSPSYQNDEFIKICESCFKTFTTCAHFKCERRIKFNRGTCWEHQHPDYPLTKQELNCPECGSGDIGSIHQSQVYCDACNELFNPYTVGSEQLKELYE